jgi:uncharacterized glyoxalase superfamily protein PhnB
MQQRLTFITLGVDDLEKSRNFYQKTFGWEIMSETPGIAFFRLGGIVLGLYPTESMIKDTGRKIENHKNKSVALAHNLGSEEEVDQLFSELVSVGAEVIKKPEKQFWGGYSGYLSDPDGYTWEIAFNPFLTMDDKGNVTGAVNP